MFRWSDLVLKIEPSPNNNNNKRQEKKPHFVWFWSSKPEENIKQQIRAKFSFQVLLPMKLYWIWLLPLVNEIHKKKDVEIWSREKNKHTLLKKTISKLSCFSAAVAISGGVFRFSLNGSDFPPKSKFSINCERKTHGEKTENKTTHNNKRKRKASFFFDFLG